MPDPANGPGTAAGPAYPPVPSGTNAATVPSARPDAANGNPPATVTVTPAVAVPPCPSETV